MSLQKHPDASLCLHPETWSLPSGSHFQTHQTPLTAWPGFLWRCCREETVPNLSIITLSLSFIYWKCWCTCSPGRHTRWPPLLRNARPSGVREYIELNYQHSALISLCADSLLPVASDCTRKKMSIPEEGERTCFRVWEESEEELWNMLGCICRQMAHHSSGTPLQQLSV